MQLLINHLTRMQKGFMCVAGIDLNSGRHIRPVVAGQMKIDMLAVHGGPFELRRIVELGRSEFIGRMPEIEDRLFQCENAIVVDAWDPASFWQAVADVAHESLTAIFGPDLQFLATTANQTTAAVLESRGLRSLGCYWALNPAIEIQNRRTGPRVRFNFTDNDRRFDLPVTDIRCFGADHVTPCADTVSRLQRRLKCLPRVVTAIGLSRACRHQPDSTPMHWLQINNVYLPVDA